MGNPKVSIIVPVYNVEKYIHRCIDSILAQTFTDFECILVDDCSPDNCPALCDDYAKQDNRIKVIHKTQNEGLPLARKTGFENSSGGFIQFIDSDDWIEPDMIEKLYIAIAGSDADIVTCDYYKDEPKGYRYIIQTLDTENHFNNLGFIHSCSIWNKIYRKELLLPLVFPKAGKYEDRVITQQALYFARKIIKIPYPLYHYCYNDESMSHEISVEKYIEWRDNILFVIDFLHKNLKDKYALKNEDINDYVNKFKFKVLRNRLLFKDKSLFFFYPESKFYKWFFIRLLVKTIYLLIPYGLLLLCKKERK